MNNCHLIRTENHNITLFALLYFMSSYMQYVEHTDGNIDNPIDEGDRSTKSINQSKFIPHKLQSSTTYSQ